MTGIETETADRITLEFYLSVEMSVYGQSLGHVYESECRGGSEPACCSL